MNTKDRIQNAIAHKEGKIPVDLGAFPTTGIHISTMEKLRDYYGLEKRIPKVFEPYQMLGEVEDDLREAIGVATKPLWGRGTMYGFENSGWKEWAAPWGQTVLVADKFVTTENANEIQIYAEGDTGYPPAAVMPKTSFFFDSTVRQKPIDEDNLNPEDNLEEFGYLSDEDVAYFQGKKRELEGSGYYITGNLGGTAFGDIALVPGPMLKDPKGIRDVAEWYMATAIHQDYIHQVFEKQAEIALVNLEKIHETTGDLIDVVYICGNDFGTQNAPFCSAETFRSLYAPYYKMINGWIHKNTKWKTFKHSCGAIEPLIRDLIDVGFDILNPVQWTASGMEAKHLKREYGKDVVFWGGGVDTQHTLPFGTPEEVRKQVLDVCSIFADGGGFVFNPIHNIMAMTPVENLVAMYDAVKEFNGER